MADGPNSLPATGQRGLLMMIVNIIREPMLMLLIACGIVYLILGDPQEAALLLCGVVFIFGITIAQEQKTERALNALKDLSCPRTLVIRGGHRNVLPSHVVVRGDLVVLWDCALRPNLAQAVSLCDSASGRHWAMPPGGGDPGIGIRSG